MWPIVFQKRSGLDKIHKDGSTGQEDKREELQIRKGLKISYFSMTCMTLFMEFEIRYQSDFAL